MVCFLVEKLFTTLVSNGFAPEAVEVNRHWMDCLPEEFHEFAGDYHGFNGRWPPFQFYTGDSNDPDPTPCVKLKLAPPLSDKKVGQETVVMLPVIKIYY